METLLARRWPDLQMESSWWRALDDGTRELALNTRTVRGELISRSNHAEKVMPCEPA